MFEILPEEHFNYPELYGVCRCVLCRGADINGDFISKLKHEVYSECSFVVLNKTFAPKFLSWLAKVLQDVSWCGCDPTWDHDYFFSIVASQLPINWWIETWLRDTYNKKGTILDKKSNPRVKGFYGCHDDIKSIVADLCVDGNRIFFAGKGEKELRSKIENYLKDSKKGMGNTALRFKKFNGV